MSKWSTPTAFAVFASLTFGLAPAGAEAPAAEGLYRGTWEVVKFDLSPPLAEIVPGEIPTGPDLGGLMVDPDVPPGTVYGPQDYDPIVQTWTEAPLIPGPFVSFDAQDNLSSVAPPDPVGDIGFSHYISMSNLYFAVYDKAGTLLYGPAANNTLWSDFGGACQTRNDGDPIVLHDQLADRWILTQFTAAAVGGLYFNCVAVSATSNPLGSWYRYAFSTGVNFPDYPKYGIFEDAIYISTREFTSTYVGVGAYAVNRAQLMAGNPNPTVISFFVNRTTPSLVGDGLLPADLDGPVPPPPGSPGYFVGSMDQGGPYAATQDALTFWKFKADFATPANSSFVLTNTLPIALYDTIFPCSPGSRNCIPQPGTSVKIDILSYRQRPLHRLAYRNHGTHESLVTNQSVEASSAMAGIRWWELRLANGTPVVHQEGTYAPGTSDTIHRWMGSIAMDAVGNMALGYSASNSTSVYPSSWYTGRLAGSPVGIMDQGEGSIVNGTGSQTSSSARWGDYTSMNVDPADDCSFWYVNQYLPTTGAVSWRLRVGAFRFLNCASGNLFRDNFEVGSFSPWSSKTP